MLDKIIGAGVDVVRVNFSHGSAEEHLACVERVRNRARAHGRQVGVLVDLQGPKIRIERFAGGTVTLKEGQSFALDVAHDPDTGSNERVGCTYKQLPDDVSRGDTLLLDDGRIVLWVEEVQDSQVMCRVTVGGELKDRKGID